MKRARKLRAVRNIARGTWVCFPVVNGKRTSRKLGLLSELTQQEADKRAEEMFRSLNLQEKRSVPTVSSIIVQYRLEKMPTRRDTRRAYEVWLKNYIIPRWGECLLSDVQARPVELWLTSLVLSSKSKVHIRGLLRILWEFAMWCGAIPVQRNPMELVTVKGATKRKKKPRSLASEEVQSFVRNLHEPFRTIALVCVCFGLRISEALALRWRDIDWLNQRLQVERGIVCQIVDDVKTPESERAMHIAPEMLEVFRNWKQASQFSTAEDWMFASPMQAGRLPWSYDQVWRVYQKAAKNAGIGGLGTHVLRHTYRSLLDAVRTPIAVQQKLMRHVDIRTTMNTYGDVVTDEMAQAHGRVVRLLLPNAN